MFEGVKIWWYGQQLKRKRLTPHQYVELLGNLQAVDSLIEALSDREVRGAAARMLGRLGDEQAVKPLISLLNSSDSDARASAARALGELGDKRAVDPLIRRFGKGCPSAALALGKLKDERAISPLVDALGSESEHVRLAAAAGLLQLGESHWAELIKGDSDDLIRLGSSGDARAVSALTKATASNRIDIRCAAVAGLGNLEGPSVIEPLTKAMGDREQAVRVAAIKSLGDVGDDRAVEPLLDALLSRDVGTRFAAVEALGRLGSVRAIEPLVEALGELDGEVRQAAALALRHLGNPKWTKWIKGSDGDFARLAASKDKEALVPILRALDYGHPSAPDALRRLAGTEAVKPLIHTLARGKQSVRSSAAKALGELRDPLAVEPLIEALQNGLPAAAPALANFRSLRAIEALGMALDAEQSQVQRAAETSLTGLGTHAIEPLLAVLNSTTRVPGLAIARFLIAGNHVCAVDPIVRLIRVLLTANDFEKRRAAAEVACKLAQQRSGWLSPHLYGEIRSLALQHRDTLEHADDTGPGSSGWTYMGSGQCEYYSTDCAHVDTESHSDDRLVDEFPDREGGGGPCTRASTDF